MPKYGHGEHAYVHTDEAAPGGFLLYAKESNLHNGILNPGLQRGFNIAQLI